MADGRGEEGLVGMIVSRLLGPLALAVAPLWAASALAFTPADVVAAAPESERSLRQAADVSAAERGLASARAGSHASLRLSPALDYGADIEDAAALAPSLDLGLELGWRFDQVVLQRDRASLLYRQARLRHWRRVDVRDALRLLGRTLRAEVALQRAELAVTRASGKPDDAPALLRARALVTARRHALQDLRFDARELGFPGDPRLEPAAFVLPPAPAAPPARERMALALDAVRLERDRAAIFDALRDVSLDAIYESRSDRFQLTASVSLDRGRPAVTLGGEVGNQEDDQWAVRLSADIRLDAAAMDARATADEKVRRAQAELDAVETGYARNVRQARAAAEDAQQALDAELAAWREEAGTRRPRAPAADRPAGLATRSEAACRTLLARENAVYGAWLELVTATFDYLEVVDGSWATEPRRSDGAPPETLWPVRPSGCASSPLRAGARAGRTAAS